MIVIDISKEKVGHLSGILMLFLLLSSLMVNVYARNNSNTSIQTHAVEAGIWQPISKAFAQIQANSSIKLQLSFAIQIKKTFVQKGDKVKQGQALLAVHANVIQHDLERYQIARKKQLKLKEQLFYLNKNIKKKLEPHLDIFPVETANIQVEKEKTDAWLVLATHLNELGQSAQPLIIEKQLDKDKIADLAIQLSQLYAPFAARLMTRLPISGYRYEAGESIVELKNIEQVYIAVYIAPEKVSLWSNGETYLLKNNKKIPLKFTRQPPVIDPATGLSMLFFSADNPDNRLQDGEWLGVIHLQQARQVLWVPKSAVVSRNGQSWCLLKQNNGDIKAVPVRVGQAQNNQIPVLKGLQKDQQVVTQGAYELLYHDLKSLIHFVD